MLVVRITEPQADGFDAMVVEAPFAPAGPLRLLERDIVLALGRRDARNEVGAVEGGIGEPQVAIPKDVGAAERVAAAVEGGVGLAAGRAGYAVVVGGAREGVGVNDEIPGAGLDDGSSVAPVVDGAIPAARLDHDAVHGDRGRDAIVDGVDDAADGLRAVAQRRRP